MIPDVAVPAIVYVHLNKYTTKTTSAIYALKMLLIFGIRALFKRTVALDIPMKIITGNAGVMIALPQLCVCLLKFRSYGHVLLALYSMRVSIRSGQRIVIIYANSNLWERLRQTS